MGGPSSGRSRLHTPVGRSSLLMLGSHAITPHAGRWSCSRRVPRHWLQLEGLLEALKGIFARLIRGTPMPDNQEIGPWWLLPHWESSLSTPVSSLPRGESDTHTSLFPEPVDHTAVSPSSQICVYGRHPAAYGACEHGTSSFLSIANASPAGRVQAQRAQTMPRCS